MAQVGFILKAIVVWLLICLAFGCGSSDSTVKVVAEPYQNLRLISLAYLQATNSLNRGPKNLKELMVFLKKQGDPVEILRSPRDGEEFVIHWGVDYRTFIGKAGGLPVLAYEKNGEGGRRYVLQVRNIDLITYEQFSKLPFPPGSKAP